MSAEIRGQPAYYTASETPEGVERDGYVAVAADPEGSVLIGLAIPSGVSESEAGDQLAVFSLVVDGEELPGLWTCWGREFVRHDPIDAGW